jgi:hypothetical protein
MRPPNVAVNAAWAIVAALPVLSPPPPPFSVQDLG